MMGSGIGDGFVWLVGGLVAIIVMLGLALVFGGLYWLLGAWLAETTWAFLLGGLVVGLPVVGGFVVYCFTQ